MKIASYVQQHTVQVTKVDEVAVQPGHVRVRVAFTGLCGTDLHIFHGHMDARVARPLAFGHEMSGTIESLGSGVTGWQVGDRVTVMPLAWDGTCPACLAGHQHICQNLEFIGIDSPGSLQELWSVPVETLVRLPDGLALRDAALVEPVAVAVHDVRRAGTQPGQKVVVIGGGPIGMLIATVARHAGADVLVVELDANRRAILAGLGFGVIDPASEVPLERVEQWTDGAGADAVFEVSGAAAAVATATGLAKVRGTLVIVAIHPTPREVDLQRVFWRELTILGARVYQRADFETAVELLRDGVVPVDTLITDVVPIEDVQQAMEALESGGPMKILVAVTS